MSLPIKAHYATVAMLSLAQHYHSGTALPARTIATEQQIPSQFLVQILQHLRASGLVTSTRGSSGGFKLVRSPEEISVADVVDAVCPASSPFLSGETDPQSESQTSLHAAAQGVWVQLEREQRQRLESTYLSELLESLEPAAGMFYI